MEDVKFIDQKLESKAKYAFCHKLEGQHYLEVTAISARKSMWTCEQEKYTKLKKFWKVVQNPCGARKLQSLYL